MCGKVDAEARMRYSSAEDKERATDEESKVGRMVKVPVELAARSTTSIGGEM